MLWAQPTRWNNRVSHTCDNSWILSSCAHGSLGVEFPYKYMTCSAEDEILFNTFKQVEKQDIMDIGTGLETENETVLRCSPCTSLQSPANLLYWTANYTTQAFGCTTWFYSTALLTRPKCSNMNLIQCKRSDPCISKHILCCLMKDSSLGLKRLRLKWAHLVEKLSCFCQSVTYGYTWTTVIVIWQYHIKYGNPCCWLVYCSRACTCILKGRKYISNHEVWFILNSIHLISRKCMLFHSVGSENVRKKTSTRRW